MSRFDFVHIEIAESGNSVKNVLLVRPYLIFYKGNNQIWTCPDLTINKKDSQLWKCPYFSFSMKKERSGLVNINL